MKLENFRQVFENVYSDRRTDPAGRPPVRSAALAVRSFSRARRSGPRSWGRTTDRTLVTGPVHPVQSENSLGDRQDESKSGERAEASDTLEYNESVAELTCGEKYFRRIPNYCSIIYKMESNCTDYCSIVWSKCNKEKTFCRNVFLF